MTRLDGYFSARSFKKIGDPYGTTKLRFQRAFNQKPALNTAETISGIQGWDDQSVLRRPIRCVDCRTPEARHYP